MSVTRCWWCEGDSLYEEYHDQEWGVPEYDDQRLFEMLNLEGAQAGFKLDYRVEKTRALSRCI